MNQKGFMTVALLVLMPLLLTVLAVVAATYLVLKADGQTKHACRTQLLKAQEEVAADLNALLALNAKAKWLRIEREIADKAVKYAPAAPLKGGAALYQQTVILRQALLAFKQKALVVKGKARSRTSPHLALASVTKSLLDRRGDDAPTSYSSILRGRASPAAFDVVARPKDSLTPDYQPSKRFEVRQVMRVEWQLDVNSLLPRWIGDLLKNAGLAERLKIKAQCSSMLVKEKNRWVPKLKKDKY